MLGVQCPSLVGYISVSIVGGGLDWRAYNLSWSPRYFELWSSFCWLGRTSFYSINFSCPVFSLLSNDCIPVLETLFSSLASSSSKYVSLNVLVVCFLSLVALHWKRPLSFWVVLDPDSTWHWSPFRDLRRITLGQWGHLTFSLALSGCVF